jgi:hypothetical protein
LYCFVFLLQYNRNPYQLAFSTGIVDALLGNTLPVENITIPSANGRWVECHQRIVAQSKRSIMFVCWATLQLKT